LSISPGWEIGSPQRIFSEWRHWKLGLIPSPLLPSWPLSYLGDESANERKAASVIKMRIALTAGVLAALLFAPTSHAQTNRACTIKATEALPHIAGLVIKKSRTRPVPATILESWKGKSQPIMIDMDVVAAGEAQTFSYMCVVTHGSAFVQRTMN
jgi:hypothetical protein